MATIPSASPQTLPAASIDVHWHALPASAISARLGVDPASGLNDEVARNRFLVFGPNRLSAQKQETVWDIFLEEIREPMIVLLLITGVLYGIWGELACLSQLTSVFRHFRPLFSRNSLRCNDGVSPPCVGQTYPLFNGRKLCHSAHSDASENAPAKQRRQGASLFQRGREPAPAHREDRSAPRALPGRDQ